MKPEKLFKEINDLHAANIGHAQSTAENAVIIGVKFHQLKEVLPYGTFEEAARKATKVSDPTRSRYMLIAEERLIEQRAIKLLSETNSPDGKSFTVKLLDDPDQQAIPVEVRDQARAQVRANDFKWTALDIKAKDLARGLESADVMALFRDYKAIRDKKPKQHVAPRELTPDEKIANENALHEAALIDIENSVAHALNLLAGISKCVPTKRLKQNLRTVVSWTKALRPLTKRKLSPAEKKDTLAQKKWDKLAAKSRTDCLTNSDLLADGPIKPHPTDSSHSLPAAKKAFGWEVTVAFHPGSGKPDKTFHYHTPYESTAKRKAVMLPNFDHVISTEPVPEDQWLRAYGTPGQRM